jgi:hypothetical protein
MEQILIYTDRARTMNFEQSVEQVAERSNQMTDLFHEYQDFRRIETYDDFLELLRDPVAMFDTALVTSADLKTMGRKLKPDPERVAELFGIDRDNYIIQTNEGITYDEFIGYNDYLTFDNGRICVNDLKVKEKIKQFQYYASTPGQVQSMKHFQELVKVLNRHFNLGFCGPALLKQMSNLLGFRYDESEFRILLNEETLINLLQNK